MSFGFIKVTFNRLEKYIGGTIRIGFYVFFWVMKIKQMF